jgi:hypothetical protein
MESVRRLQKETEEKLSKTAPVAASKQADRTKQFDQTKSFSKSTTFEEVAWLKDLRKKIEDTLSKYMELMQKA